MSTTGEGEFAGDEVCEHCTQSSVDVPCGVALADARINSRCCAMTANPSRPQHSVNTVFCGMFPICSQAHQSQEGTSHSNSGQPSSRER